MITTEGHYAPANVAEIVLPSERPFCVRVRWLTAYPGWAQLMEYRDGSTGCWLPADTAACDLDPGWCVEVRLTEGAS